MTRSKRTVTFADLRDGDQLLSKNGQDYPVGEVWHHNDGRVAFVVDGKFPMNKHRADPATIIREWGDRDASQDAYPDGRPDTMHGRPSVAQALTQHDAAVQAAQEGLGASVVTEVTVAEQTSADDATEEQPAQIKAFVDMTDLEQRSHQYVLHGIWPKDSITRKQRVAEHADWHAGRVPADLRNKLKPHVHSEPEGKK